MLFIFTVGKMAVFLFILKKANFQTKSHLRQKLPQDWKNSKIPRVSTYQLYFFSKVCYSVKKHQIFKIPSLGNQKCFDFCFKSLKSYELLEIEHATLYLILNIILAKFAI